MTALLLFLLSFVLTSLANATDGLPFQVALAFRSDSIVLVQLGNGTAINYTIRRVVDQAYRNLLTMMRDGRMNQAYSNEYYLHLPSRGPSFNQTLADAYPVADYPYAHIVARNIRPLIQQAKLELGDALVCNALIYPPYRIQHTPVLLLQLTAGLGGCGMVDIGQISTMNGVLVSPDVYNTIDLNQREDCKEQWSGECFTGLCVDRFAFLLEIEPSYIRFSVVVIKPSYSWIHDNCGYTCDRTRLTITDSLLDCIMKFRDDSELFNEIGYFLARASRRQIRDVKSVFVSGSLGSQQEKVKKIIHGLLGHQFAEEMDFDIDPELLGAYGGACSARRSRKLGILTGNNSWDDYPSQFRRYHELSKQQWIGLNSVGAIHYPADW